MMVAWGRAATTASIVLCLPSSGTLALEPTQPVLWPYSSPLREVSLDITDQPFGDVHIAVGRTHCCHDDDQPAGRAARIHTPKDAILWGRNRHAYQQQANTWKVFSFDHLLCSYSMSGLPRLHTLHTCSTQLLSAHCHFLYTCLPPLLEHTSGFCTARACYPAALPAKVGVEDLDMEQQLTAGLCL